MGLGDPRSSSSRRFCSTPLWGHGTSERKTLRQKLQWPLKKKRVSLKSVTLWTYCQNLFFFQVDILTLWYRHKLVKVWWIFPVDFSSFSKEKTKKISPNTISCFFWLKVQGILVFAQKNSTDLTSKMPTKRHDLQWSISFLSIHPETGPGSIEWLCLLWFFFPVLLQQPWFIFILMRYFNKF